MVQCLENRMVMPQNVKCKPFDTIIILVIHRRNLTLHPCKIKLYTNINCRSIHNNQKVVKP